MEYATDYGVTEQAKSGPGLLVVLYLRMSLKEQRLSVQQQRQECRAYADARGWRIIGEYVDDGKSGSKELAKRVEFHRMVEDAKQPAREWQAILCWDSSRFGRLDTLDGAPHKNELRRAGVWLETTKGERIDWSTSIGRIMDAVQSEQHHEYSLKISRDGNRGRRLLIDMGYMATPVPYGYDRRYTEHGVEQMVVPRRKVFSKPRNWRLKPVPNAEASTVKWLFEQWAKRDLSLGQTVRELYDRGIPSPAGEPSWTLAQVKRVLTDPIYTGAARIGKGNKTKEVHNRIGERQKADAHEALVDLPTFKLVGQKVKRREGKEWKAKSNSGALSGVLKCGKCGHTLARRVYSGYQYYVCESAAKRPHHGCSAWRACEDEMLPLVCAELLRAVDFELLSEHAYKRDKPDEQLTERLRKQVAGLKAQVDRAVKRALLVDDASFEDAQQVLSDLRQRYEREANALKLLESNADKAERAGWAAWWQQERPKLVTIKADGAAAAGHPAAMGTVMPHVQIPYTADGLRSLLQRLQVEVVLHWTRHGRRNWRLTTGTLRATFARQYSANGDGVDLEVAGGARATPARPARRPAWRPAPSR